MGYLNWHTIVCTVLLGMPKICFPQNIVQNPSFETYFNCPVTLGNLEKDLVDWQSPTLGSTDYFNGCSEAMGTPKNFNGEQNADFGVGYVGFYMYAPDDYREYVQGKLASTLLKGETYTISFYVSLAERSDFAVKKFGIRFSEFPVSVATKKVLSNRHWSQLAGDTSTALEIGYAQFYADEKDWILISDEFVANGTENYVVIGNFKDNRKTQRFQTQRNITKGSYYYLDMVSVHRQRDASEAISNEKATPYELDAVHVFKDVLFNFNKATLKERDQQELEDVFSYLTKNPSVNIKISGHTDAIGSEVFNQKLSLHRAKAVATFLVKRGIPEDRIRYEGFGSTQPVSTNKTKAGRLLNRRVEFVLLQ